MFGEARVLGEGGGALVFGVCRAQELDVLHRIPKVFFRFGCVYF